MKSELIKLLETFDYPVFLQGSMNSDDSYPASFFTFWNFESPDGAFYDNDTYKSVYRYWVYFYSDDPILVDTKLLELKKLLKDNNWVVDGNGIDVISDINTHTGRMYEVYKIIS